MTQKFFKGDLVWVGDMPMSMSHFSNNCKAIVIHSGKEAYDSSSAKDYSLYILKKGETGECSWYHENQLTLIEPDRLDLLPKSNLHRQVYEAKKKRDKK
jgi:hypothetical protein